jgi:hypothetical protein
LKAQNGDINDHKKPLPTKRSEEEAISSKIMEYNRLFSNYSSVEWDRLPDIELYMDQVITFLNRNMEIYRKDPQERIVTPSMINNYAKDHVIPRAEAKKYSKEHIALIIAVCSLKKVLSMPDLSIMLRDFTGEENADVAAFYEKFRSYQQTAIRETTDRVAEFLSAVSVEFENEHQEMLRMNDLALQLAVYSQISCILSEQILSAIDKNKNRSS